MDYVQCKQLSNGWSYAMAERPHTAKENNDMKSSREEEDDKSDILRLTKNWKNWLVKDCRFKHGNTGKTRGKKINFEQKKL